MDEFELIRRFFQRKPDSERVRLGVGDDAAIVAADPGCQLVMTMDTLIEGRHFPEQFPAADVGWRSLAVNLSDLAAMGAEPVCCLLSLSLPRVDPAWLEQFAEGFFSLAGKVGIDLVGGDTVRGPLAITVQATGQVPEGVFLRRAGARPGDRICIGGVPGEAAAGLGAWQAGLRGKDIPVAFSRPRPQLSLGRRLRRTASACIDVSDGLLADLNHVLEASGGLGAELELPRFPASELLAGLADSERLYLQLYGGDDYVLLFTLPPGVNLPQGCHELGRITAAAGIRLRDGDGVVTTVAPLGYNHFPQEVE